MKKSLLLAGVACVLISTNASAAWSPKDQSMKHYIGVDYVYDDIDFKGAAGSAEPKYNTVMVNMGTRMNNFGVELFGQWSESKEKGSGENEISSSVNAYGMDLYSYMPIGCEGTFDLVGTMGVADYYYKVNTKDSNDSNNRIGWRVGGGAMYNFSENMSARLIGRFAYIGSGDINHIAEATAGLRYSF